MLQRHVPSCESTLLLSCNTNLATNLFPRHVARSSTCWTLWDMLQGQNFAGMRCRLVCTAVQRVHATESAFQPITNNDQNSTRSYTEKKIWRLWKVEFALIGIDEKAYYCINDVDGWIRTCCCETKSLVPSMLASPRRTTRISHNFKGVSSWK